MNRKELEKRCKFFGAKGAGGLERMTPSKEDYLEAILDLAKAAGPGGVKSVDVAAALGYSRASISRAISKLKQEGYLLQEPYGPITLTPKGEERAHSVRKRHDLLRYYLLHIVEVSDGTAEADACKMEHIVSGETLCRIEEISRRHMREFHGKPDSEKKDGNEK